MSNILGTYQKSITTAAAQIVLADDSRQMLVITKIGSQDVYLGCNLSVSSTNGHQFAGACGAMITLGASHGAIWAIAGAGSTTLTVLEVRG